MKIKIKTFNGELPSYLTAEKEYEVLEFYTCLGALVITTHSDTGEEIKVRLDVSERLNGGSWEVINE